MTEPRRGFSGMVRIGKASFLVAHDTKKKGARLGVLDVKKDGTDYQEVPLADWPKDQALPNDLEGVTSIPSRKDEFLLAESGYYPEHGKFGRVLRVQLAKERGRTKGRVARYAGHFRPLLAPKGETPKEQQIEGIGCVARDGAHYVVLAQRGKGDKPAVLILGKLGNLGGADPTFAELGRTALRWPQYPLFADRGAADIWMKEVDDGSWSVLCVGSTDYGDLGPFRSSIYRAGTLTVGRRCSFRKSPRPTILWELEGLKVEALAAPAQVGQHLTRAAISIATDDENYGGVWRPLFQRSGGVIFKQQYRLANLPPTAR